MNIPTKNEPFERNRFTDVKARCNNPMARNAEVRRQQRNMTFGRRIWYNVVSVEDVWRLANEQKDTD
jgi:hypothetical protein